MRCRNRTVEDPRLGQRVGSTYVVWFRSGRSVVIFGPTAPTSHQCMPRCRQAGGAMRSLGSDAN